MSRNATQSAGRKRVGAKKSRGRGKRKTVFTGEETPITIGGGGSIVASFDPPFDNPDDPGKTVKNVKFGPANAKPTRVVIKSKSGTILMTYPPEGVELGKGSTIDIYCFLT